MQLKKQYSMPQIEITKGKQMRNWLKHLLNINVPIEVSGNYRIGDIRHNVADLTRISLMLGYKPSVLFDEGIRKFIHWVQGQKIHQDRYEESIIELRSKGLFK